MILKFVYTSSSEDNNVLQEAKLSLG